MFMLSLNDDNMVKQQFNFYIMYLINMANINLLLHYLLSMSENKREAEATHAEDRRSDQARRRDFSTPFDAATCVDV
jgi:hypothetical protein